MKNIIIVIIASIFFTLNTLNTFAQANEVEVIAKSNCDQLTENVFIVDIYVKALNVGETVTINEQNYRFDYNAAAIGNPSIVTSTGGLGYSNPVFSDNGNISFFEIPTLTGSLGNLVSFNIEMSGGAGLPLTTANETYIGSIAFDVLNTGLPYNFNWHHFVGTEENWPPTYIGIQNSTDKASGIFTDNVGETNIAAADFTRTATHVCTINDGALSIAYPNTAAYNNLLISIDGGLTFTSAGSSPFEAEGLAVGDYDIKVKSGATGCPLTLDDINIIDLSHEVTRTWEHPTCGESNGSIELTWVKKAMPKIDLSIDGGQTYVTVEAANEAYRFENLAAGDYDIRVKWTYAPFACPTQLDDVNLGVAKPANAGLRADYYCAGNRLRLREVAIDADVYRFNYRTLTGGSWTAWKNTSTTKNGIKNIYNIPNSTKVQYRVRISCGGKWSGWSSAKVYNLPSCKLGSDLVNKIKVYPNPANQQVSVDLEGASFENGTIEIYNLAGKLVQSDILIANQSTARLQVGALTNGIYLVKVNTDGKEVHTQKLTIAH